MITLADIDAMFPETRDGSVYSDLHKDAYGFRPRGELAVFADMKSFEANWAAAVEALERVQVQEEAAEKQAQADFYDEVQNLRDIMPQATTADILRYIMQAEQADPAYGFENLEYKLGLPYGWIEKTFDV